MRKFLAMALTAALLFNTQSLVYAEETTESSDEAATEYVSGYIQSDLDYNTPVYENDIALCSDVPSSYNSIADVRNNYPEYRNQNPYGTCWAFSSIGLAEFDLINDGTADKSIDLSELQLAYFLFNSVTDPLGGTEGDSAKYYNENASNNYLNYGSNYEMASRRLAQWVGVAKESDVPYNTANSVLSNGVSDGYAYNADVAHLQNAYLINIKQNPTDVKQQIMEHGAVGIMYAHNDSGLSWNDARSEYNYYDTNALGGGHAVMVVGWDDNYSKDNFIGNQPPSDGAWLIRNSWGIYCSYFWMSYETYSLSDTAWVFDFSANDGFDNNYQLDGGLQAVANQQYTTMANVFTAKTDADVKSETLKAVSVSFTHNASVNYTIEVYTDLTDVKNPISGTKQESATTQGTTAYAGIYTIELADEVEIQPGSSFAIVVSTNNKCALEYEQAMTIATGDNLETIVWDCTVSLNNQKTFYKSGDRFYAWPWGNLCVKAFTSDNKDNTPDVETTYTITYNLDGGTNNSSNPSTYKTGNSAITLNAPTKSGYTFDGWYTDSAYTNRITKIPANSTTNYTLYAKWKYIFVKFELQEGIYGIESGFDAGQMLDISGNSGDNGANIHVWDDNGWDCQRFCIKKNGSTYTLTALNSGKNMEAADGGSLPGTNVRQWEATGSAGQNWKFYDAGDGYVYIESESSGLFVTAETENRDANVLLQMFSGEKRQKFRLVKYADRPSSETEVQEGIYGIESGFDADQMLDISGNSVENGANIHVWDDNGWDCQRFYVKKNGSTYTLTALNSGKNVEAFDGGSLPGTNVRQWEATGSAGQNWKFYDAGDGYVYIESESSGLFVTAETESRDANVLLQVFSGEKRQKFRLVKYADRPTSETEVQEGIYGIESGFDAGQMLDISGNSVENGANIHVWDNNGWDCQRFYVKKNGSTYTLTALNSGKNVEAFDGGSLPGTNVRQWEATGSAGQNWKFYDAGDGYVYIESESSGLFVTAETESRDANVLLQVFSGEKRQRFKLVKYADRPTSETEVQEGIYGIESGFDAGQMLDISGNSVENGANIHVWDNNGWDCQRFYVKKNGSTYTLTALNSGKNVEAFDGGSLPGTNVRQWEATGSAGQNWKFYDAGDGYVYIESESSGLFVTAETESRDANVLLQVFSGEKRQRFRLVKYADRPTSETEVQEGIYGIESGFDAGQMLDISGNSSDNGANIHVWDDNGWDCQRFCIKKNGSTYTLTALNSGKNMEAADGGSLPGTNVRQWEATGSAGQNWKFYDAGDGYVYIESESSGLFVTAEAESRDANVLLQAFSGEKCQKFKLVK